MSCPRRGFLVASLSAAIWAGWEAMGFAASGTIYVFVVGSARPRALQNQLEAAMPGMEVTVFGRFGDFKRKLQEAPPDAAIALVPVLEELGLAPELRGVLNGKTDEPYVLLSEQPLAGVNLSSQSVGCVDLVGRRRLPKFVSSVLDGATPDIQRVTKLEDLLPLLQFGKASAILLPKRLVSDLTSRSKMNLKAFDLPSKVGCLAAAFPRNRGAVESALKGLSSGVLNELGANGWK